MNIYQKMLAATEKINRVAKNLKVEMGNGKGYKAVSEADVLEAVKPIEIELGIYSYPIKRTVIKDEVFTTTSTYNGNTSEKNTFFMRLETIYRFVNTEKSDEFIDITTYGDGVDTQDKAPGKAMTYADKYALLKAYKIQTGDDPDQEGSKDMKKAAPKKIEYATDEQIKELGTLGVDLVKMAEHFKVGNIKELTKEKVADVIARKILEKKDEAGKVILSSKKQGA